MIRQSPDRSGFFSENSVSHSKQVNLAQKACLKVTFFAVKTLTVRQRILNAGKPLACSGVNKAIAMPYGGPYVAYGRKRNDFMGLTGQRGIVT